MNQSTVDLTQINPEEMIREMEEEKVVRVMNIIMENSKKILELQMLINKEKKKQENQKRRQEDREQRRRENKKRWEKEEQRKRKEKEEEEEKRRIDNEWRRIEEMRIQKERRVEKE